MKVNKICFELLFPRLDCIYQLSKRLDHRFPYAVCMFHVMSIFIQLKKNKNILTKQTIVVHFCSTEQEICLSQILFVHAYLPTKDNYFMLHC